MDFVLRNSNNGPNVSARLEMPSKRSKVPGFIQGDFQRLDRILQDAPSLKNRELGEEFPFFLGGIF